MKKRFRTDFWIIAGYILLFAGFMTFAKLKSSADVFSGALLSAALYFGANVIFTPLLFVLSFLALGETAFLLPSAILGVFLATVTAIRRKYGAKKTPFFALWTAVGLIGYVAIFATNGGDIEEILISALLTVGLNFILIIAFNAVHVKGLKYKFGYEEYFSLALAVILAGLGVSNLLTPLIWKTVSAVIILLSAFLLRRGLPVTVAVVVGLSPAVYFGRIDFLAVTLFWGLFAESLMPLSRYLSAVGVIAADLLSQYLFGIYGYYDLSQFLFLLIGAVIFCLIPTPLLTELKDKLYAFREKQLVRQSINRNRRITSNRLYELSSAFAEMSGAFDVFKENAVSQESAKASAVKEVVSSVCGKCENLQKCGITKGKGGTFTEGTDAEGKTLNPIFSNLKKLLDIGMAKGRITIIDFPQSLAEKCKKPSDMTYLINRLLADYRGYVLAKNNLSEGRDLIAKETAGVSEILKKLAFETGATLKYQNRLERKLFDNLLRAGFTVGELLIYGEGATETVSLILSMRDFSPSHLKTEISKTLNCDFSLAEKLDLSEDKCYICLKRSPTFDAVFGVAQAKKDGSLVSGDTHSVVRIREDKFLVALSDGMGSGEKAEKISSASLSLIESFYKAGFSGSLILNTVNKLLSVNTEDTFTALDVAVVDLNSCEADFIKYGSPYGFIIGDAGIRIVEGNSLPLGILDELKPSVAQGKLEDGDVILLLSDGISDAFASPGDTVDFLRKVPAKNPQTLAEDILKAAIEKCGGKKKDDMTALAVRIFKKSSA